MSKEEKIKLYNKTKDNLIKLINLEKEKILLYEKELKYIEQKIELEQSDNSQFYEDRKDANDEKTKEK